MVCFECGSPADHNHHVVPESRGGTKTVPLCESCHSKAHHTDGWVGTSALVKSVLRDKAQRKERTGTIPYGYRLAADGIHLEEDPTEMQNAAMIQDLYDKGMTRLKDISKTLSQKGIHNRVGNHFSLEAMRNILKGRREIQPRAKLTNADVDTLRHEVHVQGVNRKIVALKYGISLDHTNRLLAGRHRKNGYSPPARATSP